MPHTPSRLLLTLVSAAVVALVGCAQNTQPPTAAGASTATMNDSNTSSMERTVQRHIWTLTTIRPAPGGSAEANLAASTQGVQLRFMPSKTADAPASVQINGLCNRMHAAYQTKGATLQISQVAGTLMACQNDALMQLERVVGQTLPKARNWRLTGPETLEITFADGQRWQLQGTLHYEAMYGEPERIFLEVAPQLQDCTHPLMPEAQCLRVREVHYDDRGIKTGTGEWGAFYDSIEGYAHQGGLRQVLRLKRYTRQPDQVPADASRYLYVLDLVVETGPAH